MPDRAPRAVIIFDLDGTLVDSRRDLADAGNIARAALALPPLALETVTGFVGDGAEKLIERLTPDAAPAARATAMAVFKAHYAMHCLDHTVPYDGIAAALGRLRELRLPVAVATNKPLAFTERILTGTGLREQIAAVRGGDGPRKPDPAQLRSLLDELGGTPEHSWMVGDHRTDIAAGRAAGCRVLWCAWGFGHRDGLPVDAVARQPREIADLVRP